MDGFAGRRDRGRLTRSSKAGKDGKLRLRLVGRGRQLLGGCDVDFLKVVNAKAKHKKRRGKKRGRPHAATPLVKDLAACQGGGGSGGSAIPPKCDPLDPTVCMQPWPNDYFTKADASTDTGRRLDLHSDQMPSNTSGTPVDPTDFNRADGFSPGNLITLKIPQVSTQTAFDNTGFVSIIDPGAYADADQPAVVIDADTGDRQPIFAELDPNPNQPGDTQDVNLIIRPLRNFTEGHRYIVALRGIRDASDNPVAAPESFRVYRDNLSSSDPDVQARRPHMEDLFTTLETDGVPRADLYTAWDFTVASEHSLAGRALAIRDDALSQLGDTTPGDGQLDGSAPSFHVSSVLNSGDPGVPDNTYREITGELTNIPCYLNNGNCHPGGTFNFQSNGDVNATPTGTADDPDTGTTGVKFECLIPDSAVSGVTVNPTESGIFGHGLLGDFTQVGDMIKFTPSEANISNTSWCATNWAGFSSDDIATVIGVLGDVSKFPQMGDRMLQGFVNMIYLGRAMTMAGGFDIDPAFQLDPDGVGGNDPVPALNTGPGNLFWEGISQGAIMGGALTALEPDLTQSVLNVTGMNYSTLLRRSSDSGQYLDTPGVGLWAHYPDLQQRPLILSLMQLLWDRGEANGYARAHDGRSVAEYAGASRAAADGVRRPSGFEPGGRGGGAHDRRPGPHSRARDRAALGTRPALRSDPDQLVPVQRECGDGLLRRRAARLPEPRRRHPGSDVHGELGHAPWDGARTAGGAATQPDERVRLRPALIPAPLGGWRHARHHLVAARRIHRPMPDVGNRAAVLLERLYRSALGIATWWSPSRTRCSCPAG